MQFVLTNKKGASLSNGALFAFGRWYINTFLL